MRSRLHWRRAATAAGIYASVVLGMVATVVAARVLGLEEFGHFATAFACVTFLQVLLDLTVEDVLVKQGFHYVAAGEWGRLRRLFRLALQAKLAGGVVASLLALVFAPFADAVFGVEGIGVAVAAAALIPLAQAPANVATSVFLLRGRYDVRGAYQVVHMGTRLVAVVVAAPFGAWETLAAIALAQALATGAISVPGVRFLRAFPPAPDCVLGEDARPVLRFAALSSVGSVMVSLRTSLAPLILGLMVGPTNVGLFRIAQAPYSGVVAASAPVRLIFLTEQTRDWERGDAERVLRGIRRFVLAASGLGIALVGAGWFAMEWLVETVFGSEYAGATRAAQIVLVAAAIHLVFAWTKSFATTAGRPSATIIAHGVEAVVLLSLTIVLAHRYGIEGAAAAVVASAVAYAGTWLILFRRIERQTLTGLRA